MEMYAVFVDGGASGTENGVCSDEVSDVRDVSLDGSTGSRVIGASEVDTCTDEAPEVSMNRSFECDELARLAKSIGTDVVVEVVGEMRSTTSDVSEITLTSLVGASLDGSKGFWV